jgi:hypothetical protein
VNHRKFFLKPFPGEENIPDMKITGTIGRRADILSIGYALLGNLSELAIPAPGELPERRDRLWKGTCLEFFLGIKDSERCWEFNLSPAGHCNVYRFTTYRKDMQEEPAFTSLPFRIRTEPGSLRLSLDLGLGKIIPSGEAIEVGISAVIKTVTGKRSFWALVHPGPRPDFHRRDGFVLNIHAE